MSIILECQEITKKFDQKDILYPISFKLEEGKVLSFIGPSGCGKTTLLRLIAGLETMDSGRIFLKGQDISQMKPEDRAIVLMFQQPLLFPHLTIIENVVYGLTIKGIPKRERQRIGLDLLKKVEMDGYEARYPYELSGGQKQRISLARALAIKPDIILLDEPFSSLDPDLRGGIRSWVRDFLKKEGLTAIFITHDKEEAMLLGDKIAIMYHGRIQQFGQPLEVYHYPKNALVADFYGEGLILPDESFIDFSKIKLLRELDPSSLKEKNFLEGIITGKLYKGGLLAYQVWIKNIGKESLIFSQEDFLLKEAIFLTYQHVDKYFFSKEVSSC
jgi:ABC-type Fe3+/spermidine/putrescine transport system ATPase subunit